MAAGVSDRQEWIRARRQRRKGAKLARYRRQFFRYAVLLLLLYVGIQGFALLPWNLANAQSGIIVEGNYVVPADKVKMAIAEASLLPIYKVNPKSLENKLRAWPAVKYAFIRRYAIPHPKLIVDILEEFPWATFSDRPDGAAVAVISQAGRMIPIADFPAVPQPSLKIYGPTNLKLTATDVSQWSSWSKFIAEQTGQSVDSIDMRQPRDIRIQDGNLYFKVGVADATLTRRLGRLSSLMNAISQWQGKLDYIDLALDNNIPVKLAKKSEGEHN